MQTTSQNNPEPEGSSLPDGSPKRGSLVKNFLGVIVLLVIALVSYSIYVAVHEPDPQETIILGQKTLTAASPAGLRIVVRHRASRAPVRGAQVALSLAGKSSGRIELGSFQTDAGGTVADSINIPDLPAGEYELTVNVTSSLGRDHITKKVDVRHPMRILLSSDKPLYQPGQTIHLRSLVSNARTQKPVTNEPVIFEVSDPKGNKVFKETRNLSAFGIASADFVLAMELNLGRYAVRAISGPTTTERTVEIKRYALPKFKIIITTDKSYYLPGQTVSGAIQAIYFFGKPVSGAAVKLTASTLTVPEIQGRTDASGKYSFHFKLPDYFVGLPQNNEAAWLDLLAEVVDSGQHAEQKTLTLSVAQNELELIAIPEAGALVPGVENLVYVLTSYPDGRPAVCHVFADGTAYQSDTQGVSVIKLSPGDGGRQIELQALDDSGRKTKLSFRPENTNSYPPLLLRTDKAVYQAGETAQLTALSPEGNNTVFVDVIKDGQTVLTKSVPLSNHKAQYSVALPASLIGALKINAYLITDAGEDRGRSRLIYVNPASSLQIKAHMDKAVYRPGEVGKIEFNIVDAQGKPSPSALGISAVDESVFALSENRPGLLRQFLDVEADLLKPRYQIKSFADPGSFLAGARENQNLAQAYFSSWSEKPVPSQLDELIKGDNLPPRILERIRSLRGTPEYESLKTDPKYAELLREVEGVDGGTYTFREATGPIKFQAVEAQRRAYFKSLKQYLMTALCGSIFLLPICLIIYYLSPAATRRLGTGAVKQNARYVTVASSSYHLLAALTLCPLIFYPLGFMFFERYRIYDERAGYSLLGFEALVVVLTLLMQIYSVSKAKADGLARELMPFRSALAAFFIQFFLSRAGFVLLTINLPFFGEGFIPFLFLGSLAAPLIVLGGLGSHVRRQFATMGITNKMSRVTVLDILVVITTMVVLAGLLLPALAKAKAKAIRVNLINDLKQVELSKRIAEDDNSNPDSGGTTQSAPRVRRDFPETLLWRPELITDDLGKATLEIPLADSITTWRASVDAVNSSGKMGSTELSITVFQDFFVDLDLPVSLSLNDEVSVPVTCYNYLKTPQDVHLRLAPANWFESSELNLTVSLAANEVKSVRFPIKVRRVGSHLLRVNANGTKTSDAIEREILVVPTGQQVERTRNESLKEQFSDTFAVPTDAIPGSESLQLKFYPSRFSEVVEGLDSVFLAPYGCFEQTSSTTYPNVLVLDYMKRMGRLTPEIEIKARKYINAGYQRLLTFEVPGGGFEWFGHTPAHIGLTAYGVMEFIDMSHVHPIDPVLIERTTKWLASVQNADGSWNQANGYDEWAHESPVTAYVAWALAESGENSPALEKALNYLRGHEAEVSSTYQKALAANAFLAHNRNDAFGQQLANELHKSGITGAEGKTLHWTSAGHSITYSTGRDLDVETTALCSMALMKAGLWPQSVKQSLTWLSGQKAANGTWGSTQSTILAMRALLAGSATSLGQEFESRITVLLNGEAVKTLRINKDNSEVTQQVDLTGRLHAGENRLSLQQEPAGELPFQLTGAYWLPARMDDRKSSATSVGNAEQLQIDVQYDRTTLAVNDQVNCAVKVVNNTRKRINMAIVDLGIPPGFDVDSGAFESMQVSGQIAKFEITGNQVILYLRALSETTPLRFNYTLRAKYPLRVQTPASAVYEYYQPKNRAESKPISLRVGKD